MSEGEEKKNFKNMMELVELISNVDDVITELQDKDVLSSSEVQELHEQEGPFNKKSHLFWLIKNKGSGSLSQFCDALNATGNSSAAQKLAEDSSSSNHIDAEVTIVSHHPHRQPDTEGIALAVEIEKEFERIQSEQESEASANGLSEELEPESDVRVEITAPTESEPEFEKDDEISGQAEEVVAEIEEKVEESLAKIESTPEPEEIVAETVIAEEETEPVTIAEEPVTPEPTPESPRPQKQVTFGSVTEPEEKEFILHQSDRESSPSELSKSIVAMNREKFEKSSPPTDPSAPKVKYSFAKKGGVPTPAEEEPKESTVKNLRNFFQKLGSVDAEEGSAVLKRPGGVRTGAANRRTMI